MSVEQALRDAESKHEGRSSTEAEVAEDQRITLLGPQCEVTEGGMWDHRDGTGRSELKPKPSGGGVRQQ